jgi:hypothetical protein
VSFLRRILQRSPDGFGAFTQLDRALVAAGWHPTSAWWRATLRRFLRSDRRMLVVRAGRRGGKSSTLCRLAVALAVFVPHVIPKGDVGVVAFVSTRLDEAAARLRTIRQILDALHIAYNERGNTIELRDRPIRFECFPCTVAAVSGFTSIAVIADEVAKWRDGDGANPANEVLSSLKPTMATQPNARMVLSSSPFGTIDAHAAAFDRGDTKDQLVAFAPTWIANPTISESKTHELEPNPRVWSREYQAVPGETDSSFLSASDVRACVDVGVTERAPVAGVAYVLGIDPAFRHDAFGYCVAHRELRSRVGAPPADVIVVDVVGALTPLPGRRLDYERCLDFVADLSRRYNEAKIPRDSHQGDALGSGLSTRGAYSVEVSMTVAEQWTRWSYLESLVRTQCLRLVDDPATVRELSDLRLKLRQSGLVSIAAPDRRGAHDDRADSLCLAVAAARTLPPSGDVAVETRVRFEPGLGIDVESRWFQVSPNGRRTVIDPPANTYAAQVGREARQAEGAISPSDPEWAEQDRYAAHLAARNRAVLDDPSGVPVVLHEDR